MKNIFKLRSRLIKLVATITMLTILPVLFVNMDTVQRTGMRPLTTEETKELHKRKVIQVRPNKLAIDRKNAELNKNRQKLIDPASAVSPVDETSAEIDILGTGGATADTTGTGGTAAISAAVDNSALAAFPPVGNQANESSCVAWATTYYQMSHETCLARGCDNRSFGSTVFSPRWTYNMINSGVDLGSNIGNAFNLLTNNGAADLVTLPYYAGDYRVWARTSEIWRQAINYRLNPYQWLQVPLTGPFDFASIKQLLSNGHVLTFGTYINSWKFVTVGSDPNAASPFAGQAAASAVLGTSGGHAMTVVGFDDLVWIDVNSNGAVDSGEKGAFKVANSWGSSWKNGGFIWLAYDAAYSTTTVAGGPTGKVGAFSNGGGMYYMSAKASYAPSLLAQFTVNSGSRNSLNLKGGSSSSSATAPTSYAATSAVQNQGGAYAFDGSTSAVDGTFVLDMTSLVPSSGSLNYYLSASNSSTLPLYVKDFRLINVPQVLSTAMASTISSVSGGTQYFAIKNYDFSSGRSAPLAVIAATSAVTSSGVQFDFSGANSTDSNVGGSIFGYEWNFGDGSNLMTGSSVSHVYVKQGNFTATLKVTNNFGLTSIASYAVSIADTTEPTAPATMSAVLGIAKSGRGKKATTVTVVNLSWALATDNVGVTQYQIYRNGILLTSVNGSSSFFQDSSTASGGTYTYAVRARDSAGNVSVFSPQANVSR